MKFILCVILLSFSLSACSTGQQPVASSAPSIAPSASPSAVPSPTPTLIPTLEPTPSPTSTSQPLPTAAPTQPPAQVGVFSQVASLAGVLTDSSAAMTLHAPADGSVWVITGQQALRWDGEQWQVVLTESEEMLATVDDNGRLWVLRQDQPGISVWQDGQWTTYDDVGDWASTIASSLAGWWAPEPWSVLSGSVGSAWTAMANDVRVFDGDSWRLYTQEDMGFTPQQMEDLAPLYQIAIAEADSEVWVGECDYFPLGPMGGQGVRWFDGQGWQDVAELADLSCVSAMHVDPVGNLWLGSYSTVWRYEHESGLWTSYHLPDELLFGYNFPHPLQLVVDHAGDVWVVVQLCGGASCDGPANLYRIHNGEWSLIIESDYWRSPYKELLLDGMAQAWLFWDGAAYRLNGDSLTQITPLTTLSADVSPVGQLWLLAALKNDIALLTLAP